MNSGFHRRSPDAGGQAPDEGKLGHFRGAMRSSRSRSADHEAITTLVPDPLSRPQITACWLSC
jgi:hypothetical protein